MAGAPKRLKARKLLDLKLREGICFALGDVFSASGRSTSCLRLSCGHNWDTRLEPAVNRLGEIAASTLIGE